MARLISSQLKLKFISVDNADGCPSHSFPSVTKGAVNTKKIKDRFNFEPTNIEEAFKETIDFYNNAYHKYPKHREIIEKELKKKVLKPSSDEKLKFKDFIKNVLKNWKSKFFLVLIK